MRYLFFDIECCDGLHICEFGYVVTDTQFNVIEKEVFTINPDMPFNLTGRSGQRDIELCFSEEEYNASPLFTQYYQKIKDLIEYPDQLIGGHAIENDAIFIRTACKRYNLAPINFQFVDSQRIYSDLYDYKKSVSLENAVELLSLDTPDHIHKSDDDALTTMRMMEKMCKDHNLDLQDISQVCPLACGSSNNFEIKYRGSTINERLEMLAKYPKVLSNNKRKECVESFLQTVKPVEKVVDSPLKGKKFCFGAKFERGNLVETLKLIQLLVNHGCKYLTKVISNSIFVATQEELLSEDADSTSRYSVAKNNAKVTIITFEELYDMLGVTKEQLDLMKIPYVVMQKFEFKKKEYRTAYSAGVKSNSLGDILLKSGIDLKEMFPDEEDNEEDSDDDN